MEPSDQLLIEFEEQERWRDLLGEVLAVLNRDGGHYQTKHGAGRAAIEGIRSHYQMLTTIGALQARINEAAGMFDSALWWIGEDWLRDRIRAWLAGEPCPTCGNAGVDAQGYECSCKEERQ